MIRAAKAEDYEQLVSLARDFMKESALPLTFNEKRARETLWNAVHCGQNPHVDCLVSVDDGIVAGGVTLVYESEYYDELCAYVDKFFVHKEFRGLGTSDELLFGILEACERKGAKLIFASATAGMGEAVEKLFVRLFKRHGFEVLGRIVMRQL